MTDVIRDALARALIDLNACREITRHTMGEPHGLNQTIGIVESALAALPPAGWRDISTAPKDGTTVFVGVYTEVYGFVRGTAHWDSHRGIEGWMAREISNPPGVLGLGNPTHWMPLPPAPQRTGEK